MAGHSIIEFVDFILKRVYKATPIPDAFIDKAFELTVADVNYHFPQTSREEVLKRIVTNQNELAIFLFRLGNALHQEGLEELKPQVHFLLKDLCSCEIYFNNSIDVGFYVVHGQGTVIGSRNTIGKGFMIHQGCTIGHKTNGGGAGNTIGHNVKLYCNTSILGALNIGDNVTIGAHTMVNKDVPEGATVVSTARMTII